MLTIRLQRVGRKKSPSYRLVLSENARDTQGHALEILGNYNPVANPKIVSLNTDRIKYWLELGTTASEAVHNLFVREGILTADKKKAVSISNKRKGKIDAKKASVEEAKQKAAEAVKAAKEAAAVEALAAKEAVEAEAKAAAEAPVVEETPAEEVAPVAEETSAEETEEKKAE
ncbi:MAG: 30S ribosomal protein S16 [Candidatus Magasanikbacteria bacterium CG_4_9_14_0_2_um_filter_41_10]|uniref:Small ribosomal subunit protein bS16 n=1 Tax=Candidatus Magasanikbacteria bacterium CG_4_10_14_0_2_um_filter_41_31 TaxID=1974639 RepID=A0A2M7V3J7_9BACT|nr:MAG: 30S ribosomal protein S16 [Candidatus Magasanikbacteria bacterium CG_4_10_14_0_2_um_filter_41_31]PJC53589.1 MAG: 30S ribosomal protein S16 [Candidatus Magasanikbacteria bacterium CG_4_9_14_0_2_um_filter_41_10]